MSYVCVPHWGKAIARQKNSWGGGGGEAEEGVLARDLEVTKTWRKWRPMKKETPMKAKIIHGNVVLRRSHRVPGAVGGHGE